MQPTEVIACINAIGKPFFNNSILKPILFRFIIIDIKLISKPSPFYQNYGIITNT